MSDIKAAVERLRTKWVKTSISFDENLQPRFEWIEDLAIVVDAYLGLVSAFDAIIPRNFLREYRNTVFQLPGMSDGSMSDECTKKFRDDYKAINDLCDVLNMKPRTRLTERENGARDE